MKRLLEAIHSTTAAGVFYLCSTVVIMSATVIGGFLAWQVKENTEQIKANAERIGQIQNDNQVMFSNFMDDVKAYTKTASQTDTDLLYKVQKVKENNIIMKEILTTVRNNRPIHLDTNKKLENATRMLEQLLRGQDCEWKAR